MFKNHGGGPDPPVPKLGEILSQTQVNSVIYSDPFLKAGFISRLVGESEMPVLYMDMDLLYSGYVTSGSLQARPNVEVYQPAEDTLAPTVAEILDKASMSQALIVIDSINGLFNILHYKKNVGKAVASVVMMLASLTRRTNSQVVITSMARFRKEEGWVLSPTGRRFIETKKSKKVLLEHGKEGIIVNLLDSSARFLLPASLVPL